MVEAVEGVDSKRNPAGTDRAQHLIQFIKFCIIGASSATIDFGVMNLLLIKFEFNWMIAQSISFVCAVTNGFIWNSLWTFRGMGSGKRHEQYLKFVAVNIVGLILTFVIMSAILFALTGNISSPGHQQHAGVSHLQVNLAKIVAVFFVTAWNFIANKKWTFK